jgi:hypothetical protein
MLLSGNKKESSLLRHRKPQKIKELKKLRDFEESGGQQIVEICGEGKSWGCNSILRALLRRGETHPLLSPPSPLYNSNSREL